MGSAVDCKLDMDIILMWQYRKGLVAAMLSMSCFGSELSDHIFVALKYAHHFLLS